MKIKFFSLKINLVSGGGSHHTLDLKLKYLLSRGHDITLITLNAGENKFVDNPPYKTKEYGFKGGFLEIQKYFYQLLKQEENGTDIFHIDGQSLIWGAGMYKKSGGKTPTIAFINNYTSGMEIVHQDYQGLNFKQRIANQLRDWLYYQKRYLWEQLIGLSYANKLDLYLFDSPVIKQIYNKYGFDKNKSLVLPEFIDIINLQNTKITGQSPFVKKNNGLYLLYVGRLTFDKGVDLLLAALNGLKDRRIFLNIVGDGPQKEYLISLIKKYHLKNYVSIFPWQNQQQLIQFYYFSDLLAHPCRWPEPFGRTIVEAMAFGKPVITASHSGSAWAAGSAGITFQNGDISDLKNKIILFLNNARLLTEYGPKAKIRAREFDYQTYAAEFEKFLFRQLNRQCSS